MNTRQRIEELEKSTLSVQAIFSNKTKGRLVKEEKCNIRTEFQRDRDRIIHSKSFRRLKHKTQVFIAPEGDHYRTRLTHTLEVAQISRTLARALKLNEDLTEAIALGHDLGHTPFGHTGETVLDELHPKGFKHNHQSLRVVDILEHDRGRVGLNLTHEVRDGILNHTGDNIPSTLEGELVRIADRIAYINHDIDDAIRANVISIRQLPEECIQILGETHGERINTMILDVVKKSINENRIEMSEQIDYYTKKLRDFMFEKVYLAKNAKKEEIKAKYIIAQIYNYYTNNLDELPEEHIRFYKINNLPKKDMVCDYIAGMTDRYAINTFYNLFIPRPWEKY